MKVSNKKCIRRLAVKRMGSSRSANIIAASAIALTTVLFTALFTIVMSIAYGYEQSNFRKAGGYSHGGFKYLTEEQFDELKTDPLIKEYSNRIFVGMPSKYPFNKSHVEISYCDENAAKWMFIDPKEGRLPEENSNEAATDTRVLSLLGVTPKIGTEFTVTFDVDGTETTETFTLCGWWDYDEAMPANHVLIPMSRANEIFSRLGTQGNDGMTGSYNMDVMLGSSTNIGSKLNEILANHGYQSEDRSNSDTFISIGVNWGYIDSNFADSLDLETIAAFTAMLLLIIFTGYLIIYNVFRISVSNDIRYYGLLKTIGTTSRQIRRIIFIQSMTLSAVGIPIGLILGYIIGTVLTPIVINNLNSIQQNALSVNPIIFIGAALFSLITVIISCLRPERIAANVSPVEALRYTESVTLKSVRKSKKAASIPKMAAANLGRSKGRTIITVLSLSLAVTLFNITYSFTNGFDLDKYLSDRVITDFVFANSDYFQYHGENTSVTLETIEDVNSQGGIADGGITYADVTANYEYVPEDYYRSKYSKYGIDSEAIDMITDMNRQENGTIEDEVRLYGMDDFCLDKLNVLEGDIDKLKDDGNYIAAVYFADDYGDPQWDSNWARLGDMVKIRYLEEYEYYNPDTGEVYDNLDTISDNEAYSIRPLKYNEIEYEVAAIVDIPNSISYRIYGIDQFVLSSESFKRATNSNTILYYAFDMTDSSSLENMENYLTDYSENVNTDTDFESKKTYEEEFDSFKSMFTILGTALSFIVGLVGILNFTNAILSGIFARRRELAVLRAIGMTERQLKKMLITEGIYYTLGSILLSAAIYFAVMPVLSSEALSFSFFTFKTDITPILFILPLFVLLGILLPIITYKVYSKQTIVERLQINS